MQNADALHFISDTGKNFVMALGMHNYKRWGDLVPNLSDDESAVVLLPQCYGTDYPFRADIREK
jgi:hypothetical protein